MKVLFTFSAFFITVFMHAQSSMNCNNLFVSLSSDGQNLYFSSDRHSPGGNYEIYKSDIDGVSNLIRLTNTSVNNLFAHESPDGSKVIWQSGDASTTSEIWMMNSNGTNQIQLTNNSVHDGFPNFSPSGQTIVFEAWDLDAYPEIFTMNSDGSNRTQITQVAGAYWQSAPIYDPTGNYIYVSMGYNADNHYTRMNTDGSNWVDITPPNSFGTSEGGLTFSPDGTKIIFLTTEFVGYNNGSDIIIADLDGSNWNQITTSNGGAYYYFPVWAASNDVYFSYNSNGSSYWSINKMTSAGANNVVLTNCSGVGVEEQLKVPCEFFPNPATDILTIQSELDVHAEIYDLMGANVLSVTGSEIDIVNLEKGMYNIVVLDSKQNILRRGKFIKA